MYLSEDICNSLFLWRIMRKNQKSVNFILVTFLLVILMGIISLFSGSSQMTIKEALFALMGKGTPSHEKIIWSIRIPRLLAAIIAGAGLSVSGLIMQTTLNNKMASPSTLGVSNGAVFGANLSIIAFSGGFLSTGSNINNYIFGLNPYSTSFMAFIFSTASILLILGLCNKRGYSPDVVVLAGIGIGAIWSAATTILQFYATDVGLSAAVVWSFGDLGRATYKTDLIILIVVLIGTFFFQAASWRLNTLLSGDATARSMGVNVNILRFISLLFSSVITAVCVSFLGVIGFVGIICPHITKKLIGQDHRYSIPLSFLTGSLLLILSDTLSRCIGNGSALPVGAVTALFGAPFFIGIIFKREGK